MKKNESNKNVTTICTKPVLCRDFYMELHTSLCRAEFVLQIGENQEVNKKHILNAIIMRTWPSK